jgi:hypothetical protein
LGTRDAPACARRGAVDVALTSPFLQRSRTGTAEISLPSGFRCTARCTPHPVFSPQTSHRTVADWTAYEDERLGSVGVKCPVCPPITDIGQKTMYDSGNDRRGLRMMGVNQTAGRRACEAEGVARPELQARRQHAVRPSRKAVVCPLTDIDRKVLAPSHFVENDPSGFRTLSIMFLPLLAILSGARIS